MVTAQEVKDAMIAQNIAWVESHACSLCGVPVGWIRHGEQLSYRSSCGCTRWVPDRPCDWQEAADTINMQARASEKFGDVMARVALTFGVTLPPVEAA